MHKGLELGLEIHGLGLEAQNLALRVEALVLALIFWP